MVDGLRSTDNTANTEDLFAWLNEVDKHLQERFAKFQECMQEQINNMRSDIQ